MDIRIIKTKQQYRRYLKEVDRLVALDPDPRSAQGARLELLAKLVEDYEKERFPFRKPDPIEAVLFRRKAGNSGNRGQTPKSGAKKNRGQTPIS